MKKIFSRTSFFWTVNLVFMAVSVLHAGDFFGITGRDDFARGLGFAVSFFLDLVTIILMQAMLEARYRGEENRARQFLFFIVLCCGTSTFANLAISLNDFNPVRYLPHAPLWVQVATPYVLASFPLFVIMMSIAAEMIINVRPLEQLDEGEYEADEKKRLTIMQIRNTYLQMQADEDLRLIQIRNQMKEQKLLRQSSFSWPWQRQPSPQPVDIEALKAGLIDEIKATYEPQIEMLKAQLEKTSIPPDDEVEEIFRPPIALDNWRYRDAYSDGTGALAEHATRPVQVALEEPALDQASEPTTVTIAPQTTYEQVDELWSRQGVKSVSISHIVEATGISKRKVLSNVKRFSKTPKNPDLYTVKSVLPWLKEVL